MREKVILSALLIFLLAISPGCVTNTPSDRWLTASELADQYLAKAATIADYRSEYISIDPGNQFRGTFDWKKPNCMRAGVIDAAVETGSFGISNGTVTAWYDA